MDRRMVPTTDFLDVDEYPQWVYRHTGAEIVTISATVGEQGESIDRCRELFISTDIGVIGIRCGSDGNLEVAFEDQNITTQPEESCYQKQFEEICSSAVFLLDHNERVKYYLDVVARRRRTEYRVDEIDEVLAILKLSYPDRFVGGQ